MKRCKHALLKTYNGLVTGLAITAGALLVWLGIAVIASVMQRNLGFQPSAWLFVSTGPSHFSRQCLSLSFGNTGVQIQLV